MSGKKRHGIRGKICLNAKKSNVLFCYLLLTPWILFLGTFLAIPIIKGLEMSLLEYNLQDQVFIGLENFKALLTDERVWDSVLVTLKMNALVIPGTVGFSLFVAYTIQEYPPAVQSAVKTIFYTMAFVSSIALVIVWSWMFNPSYGFYKSMCERFGWVEFNLLGDSTYSIPLISILVIGFSVPQPIMLLHLAMAGIPKEYFEAAELDGASKLQKFWKITLPSISGTILLVAVTATINNIQIIEVPKLLTGGGPNGKTTSVLLEIYNQGFLYGRYGYAAAIGVILLLLTGGLVAIQFALENRKKEGG